MSEDKVLEAALRYAQSMKWLHEAMDERERLLDRSKALENRIDTLRNNVYEASHNLNSCAMEAYDG